MTSELKQQSFDLITGMTKKERSLLLRIWNHGIECVQAFLNNNLCGYDEAARFVDEWEAHHE